MPDPIRAILFDFGGTLRKTIKRDERGKIEKVREILGLLGSDASPVEFTHLLSERYAAYQRQAEETMVELNEEQFWTQWMLPDWPVEKVCALAHPLNLKWRDATGTRQVLPETRHVIRELHQRGYRLGLVSNTISKSEVPKAMEEIGISEYFTSVFLSTVFGKRKPDPAILLAAAAELKVPPAQCAYIGNRPDRDLAAARKAGFGKAIIISGARTHLSPSAEGLTPDHRIYNLTELLEIFPSS
jgi:putative hydrolase of the HAD superfamily